MASWKDVIKRLSDQGLDTRSPMDKMETAGYGEGKDFKDYATPNIPLRGPSSDELVSIAAQRAPGWKEKRWYDLGLDKFPSAQNDHTYFEHPSHADWYNKNMIREFASSAKRFGVDPADFIALGISESGLGNKDKGNLARINWEVHNAAFDKFAQENKGASDVDYAAYHLANQFKKFPNDKLAAIQAYSGEGKLPYGGGSRIQGNVFFGKDAKKSNLWRDKPQGKRVLDISKSIMKHPEILELIDEVYKKHY